MHRVAHIACPALVLVVVATSAMFQAPAADAGTLWLDSCSHFSDNGEDTDLDGLVWQQSGNGAYALFNRCPEGGSFQIVGANPGNRGGSAQWATTAPRSIAIVHAYTPTDDVLVAPGIKQDGYAASFFWSGGSEAITPTSKCCGGMDYGTAINRGLGLSSQFGFKVICKAGDCAPPYGQLAEVNGIQLEGADNTAPVLHAIGIDNAWYEGSKWIRGTWPASFSATDASGICAMHAVVAGQAMIGPSDPTPDRHSWTQCPTPQTMQLSLDTTLYPNGPLPLTFAASDAASPANTASPSVTLRVDNSPVTLSLSGPTDAPSTAGTQYIDASATAGPSGVAGIACSVDGSPYDWHAGASAKIPVQGVGRHAIVCYASNNAIDSSGNGAMSAPASWALSIREPTLFAVGFHRVVDALRCHAVRELLVVPGHWVRERRGRRVVRVYDPAREVRRRVMVCHERTVRRAITTWVTVIHHGRRMRVKRIRLVRVAIAPHVVSRPIRRIPHGAQSTVSGWLGTTAGRAVGGQQVEVLAAADNGLGHFRVMAITKTSANGGWSARVPAGPSRLIEAVYGGSAMDEPATSAQVHLIVPAAVRLEISPTRAHWGGTITIRGRVLGGYIPAGKLLRLRIGAEGVSGTVGIPAVRRDGRFATTYTFASGSGTVRYWFSVSTLSEADYPYAPAGSRRVWVDVTS